MEESTSSIVIRKTGHISNACLKLCIIAVIVFPFYWMASTPLRDCIEVPQFPPTLFPKTVHWENYTHVLEIVPVGLYPRNSVVVSLLVLVLQYLIIVSAAYSFARHEYSGKSLPFGIVLLGFMVPQQITFLLVRFMFSKMRLSKTFTPLVLPFISNPFDIFMLRQRFMQILQEVIEAARLDDAGNMKIIFKVMMPMAKPALVTIGLLSFVSTRNSYFWPLIVAPSETFRTLPVGIAALKSSKTLQMQHIIMAGNVVLVIPILLVYMFASKKIRNSLVYSGIKQDTGTRRKRMKRKLFIISVDPLFFDDIQWLTDCPNLYGICRRGSAMQKMLSTYPAMICVAHSTVMTGCHEETHGIYHNEKAEVGVKHPTWHWYRRELGTQMIFDAVRKGGYSISVINQPVTGADSSIDYLISEIWPDNSEGDSRPRLMAVHSEGMDQLYDKCSHMLRRKYQPELGDFGVVCLKDTIRDHESDVIMLHLPYLDHARHNYGGFAPEAKHALLECDHKIGGLMDILRGKGLLEQYNLCVMGGHGHLPVKQVFNPSILLVSEGPIELDDEGRVKDYECYVHSAGLSTHAVLKSPGNKAVRHRVEHLLDSRVDTELYGCKQIFNKQQIKGLHPAGPFDYAIKERLGTSFGNSCTGQLICLIGNSDYKLSVSAHGHLPIEGPQPILFAAGPDIRENVVVERGNLTNGAPIYVAILGVEVPWAQGTAMTEILKHANGGNEM